MKVRGGVSHISPFTDAFAYETTKLKLFFSPLNKLPQEHRPQEKPLTLEVGENGKIYISGFNFFSLLQTTQQFLITTFHRPASYILRVNNTMILLGLIESRYYRLL